MARRDAEEIRSQAFRLLDQSHAADSPVDADAMRQEAAVMASLAIAAEMGDLRDAVIKVASALEDFDGHGAGVHLHYISDYLEKIADRR